MLNNARFYFPFANLLILETRLWPHFLFPEKGASEEEEALAKGARGQEGGTGDSNGPSSHKEISKRSG